MIEEKATSIHIWPSDDCGLLVPVKSKNVHLNKGAFNLGKMWDVFPVFHFCLDGMNCNSQDV